MRGVRHPCRWQKRVPSIIILLGFPLHSPSSTRAVLVSGVAGAKVTSRSASPATDAGTNGCRDLTTLSVERECDSGGHSHGNGDSSTRPERAERLHGPSKPGTQAGLLDRIHCGFAAAEPTTAPATAPTI